VFTVSPPPESRGRHLFCSVCEATRPSKQSSANHSRYRRHGTRGGQCSRNIGEPVRQYAVRQPAGPRARRHRRACPGRTDPLVEPRRRDAIRGRGRRRSGGSHASCSLASSGCRGTRSNQRCWLSHAGKASWWKPATRGGHHDVKPLARRLDEQGQAQAFVQINTDITARKQTGAKLQTAQSIAQVGSWEFNVRTGETHWPPNRLMKNVHFG
jgi:hypothetical protein